MRPTRCQLRHRSEIRAVFVALRFHWQNVSTKKEAPTVGLEPTTTRLRVLRSTN